MKLSQISTNQAADVLIIIAGLFSKITSDETLMATVGTAIDIAGKNLNHTGVKGEILRQWSGFICVLLEKHREDVFGILAAVNGVEVADVANQPIMETVKQLEEIRDDEDIIRFLSIAKKQKKSE